MFTNWLNAKEIYNLCFICRNHLLDNQLWFRYIWMKSCKFWRFFEKQKTFLKIKSFAFWILQLHFASCILQNHFAFCNNRTLILQHAHNSKFIFLAFFPIWIELKRATNFIMVENLDFIFGDDFSSWWFFHHFLLKVKWTRNYMKFAKRNFKSPK